METFVMAAAAAIHAFLGYGPMIVKGAWVYMMTSKPNRILYIGVIAEIVRRVSEHRAGLIAGFTKKLV